VNTNKTSCNTISQQAVQPTGTLEIQKTEERRKKSEQRRAGGGRAWRRKERRGEVACLAHLMAW
jgi:hypothetical protein